MRERPEPIFNVPWAVTALVAIFGLVHALRSVITDRDDIGFLLHFAFIPARYDSAVLAQGDAPGGLAADIWTFLSYAFIHGDVTHLAVNSLWLLVFGSALALRFGSGLFFGFFAITAAAGAGAHLFTHGGSFTPMVGASAAISGAMAGVVRFMFEPGGPMGSDRLPGRLAVMVPASPLGVTLRRPQVILFLLVWFALNLIFGLGTIPIGEEGQSVAWEAHIGGFLAGLVLFGLFDPVKRRPADAAVPPSPPWQTGSGPV
jgi:membrane associated rhomboid family serine protease